ncbi:hypothetical protein PB1_00240 [Bacillus methanolicus PB1]|uniref:Uncharacterized protein n=1 Tax=Bacillus methanolicus PB1 TaxID=997296 RepID=I3E4A7_BACMT|nr:hypothetical protein PB1_00240 [Bacillus methanolicus PB1]
MFSVPLKLPEFEVIKQDFHSKQLTHFPPIILSFVFLHIEPYRGQIL